MMIEIDSLSKQFGPVWAVNNLTLRIKKGEFYCLLGPNGAGKTTTLKMLASLMEPTHGRIIIGGYNVRSDFGKIKKILGLIPDTPFLYETLTPQEFLEFVGEVFAVKKKTVVEEIEHYFKMFNITQYKDVLISEVSHGTKQKIAYISNFIHHPLLYLIDEPLVGLDPYSIYLIKKLLREEVERGKTILMCTHILSIAEELADRIAIMDEGKLLVEGTPGELKEKEASDSLEHVFLKLTRHL